MEGSQELRQKPRRIAAFWLVPHGSLGLLSYTARIACPGVVTSTLGLALPHQSLMGKMLHRRGTYRSLWGRRLQVIVGEVPTGHCGGGAYRSLWGRRHVLSRGSQKMYYPCLLSDDPSLCQRSSTTCR